MSKDTLVDTYLAYIPLEYQMHLKEGDYFKLSKKQKKFILKSQFPHSKYISDGMEVAYILLDRNAIFGFVVVEVEECE